MKKIILTILSFFLLSTTCNAEVYRILNFDEESLPVVNENFRRLSGKVLKVEQLERYTEFESIIDGSLKDNDGDTSVSVETTTLLGDGTYAYSDDDIIRFVTGGTEQITISDGYVNPTSNDDIDFGTTALRFSDLYLTDTINLGSNGDDVVLDYDGTDNQLDINQDINVEKVDPEIRITDTGDSEYGRLTRADTDSTLVLYNRTASASSGALDFDGDDSCTIAEVDFSAPMTYAVWFKADTAEASQGLINLGEGAIDFSAEQSPDYIWFRYGSGTVMTGAITINTGTWYRVVITYAADNSYVFYLDGVNIASGTGGVLGGSGAYYVGTGSTAEYSLLGLVDEVAVFSEIKDQTWATADYNGGAGVYYDSTESGVEFLYHCNTGSGTDLIDSSGNSRDSTFWSGDPQWSTAGVVVGAGNVSEITVLESKDGGVVGETGINTYGDTGARGVFEGASLRFNVGGISQLRLDDGALYGTTDNDINLGSATKEFKDGYFDGMVYTDAFTVGTIRWDNGSDKIDGEQVADDTLDEDSLDFGVGVDQISLEDVPSNFTTGSIPYVTASGYLIQDNSRFFFEDGNLAIGDNSGMNNVFQAVKAESTSDVTTVKSLMVGRNINTTNNNWVGVSAQTVDTDGNIYSGSRMMTQFTSHALNAVSADMYIDTRNAGARSNKLKLSAAGDFDVLVGSLKEGGIGVYNVNESDAVYQPLEATLTDIADGIINENLVNTANPWADNEVSDTLTSSVCTGNAATVTNATLTTALTVNTGTVELIGNVANTSALTLSAGASSISGANTGDDSGTDDQTAVEVSIADAGAIITAIEVEGALQENRTAINLNTAKNTNVSTALSAGTINATTYGISSDGGADDVVLSEANTNQAGLLGADKWDEIVANTLVKHAQNADTALGAQSENLDMNTHKIVGLVDPTTNQEAATKKYVDDNASQLTQEQVDDYVNLLVKDADSVHTRVTITYDDINNAMDFVVDDMNDDVPDAGDFGNATDLDANGALNTGCVGDNEIDYTTVNMDDMGNGATNAAITLTQETNFETAYTHSQDNTQAHSDYLLNNANDTMVGVLTVDGLTLGANENIMLGAQTLDHDGTDFVFNDSVKTTTLNVTEGQVVFPATQNASANANTLDDYEEGTHTTTITCATSGTITLNSSYNKLAYTKIGKVVTVQGELIVDSVSSPVGYARISLPFTTFENVANLSGNSYGACYTKNVNYVSTGWLSVYASGGLAYCEVLGSSDNANSIREVGNIFSAGSRIGFQIMYVASN